jgi:hypothetical protein
LFCGGACGSGQDRRGRDGECAFAERHRVKKRKN